MLSKMTATTVPFKLSLLFILLFASSLGAETLQEDSQKLYLDAVRLRAENQFEEALKKLEFILARFPHHAGALAAYVELTYHLGKFDECVKRGEEALSQSPKNADLHLYIGSALSYVGRTDDAVAVLKKGAALDRRRVDFWMELGAVEQARGNLPQAEKYFKKVLELDPRQAQAALALGKIEAERGHRREARRWLEKAEAWNPNFAEPVFSLGVMALEDGDEASAEERFQKVLEIQHVHPQAFVYLAVIEEKKGRKLKEYAWMSRALPYFPREEKHQRLDEKMRRIESEYGLAREKMENFARHEIPVELGQTAEEVMAELGVPGFRNTEGNLFLYSDRGIAVNFKEGKVTQLRLEEGFRGKIHGMKIGDPVEKLVQIYGAPGESEGGLLRYRFQNEIVTFHVEKGKIKDIVIEVIR